MEGVGMIVKDIMTPRPVTIDPSSPLSKALLLMYEHDFRHLPVVDDGRLVGIVSDRDIKQTMGPPTFIRGPIDALEADLPASKVMTRDPISIHPDEELKVAIQQMVENRISCLPVIDRDHFLVGIVSELDILGYCMDLLEKENES